MSDRDLYSRLLLAKGHGYPLSYPQPSDDLPPESKAHGIEIGDVGVLTSDGGFDAFFNICRARDDVVNRFGAPVGFETLHLGPTDILSRRLYHREGSHVSNTRLNKRRLDVNTDLDNVFSPVGAGAEIEISTVSKQAAVLLMPNGACRTNLRFLKTFRHQALKHAQSWYAFLNNLGYMVENGDLYLVTGVDKTSSWIVGAVENQSQDCSICLKLKAAQIGSTGGSYAWQWETSGGFSDSGPRLLPGEDASSRNQTVFLRGFRIALHSVVWKKISQAIPVVDSKRLTMFSRRWFTSFMQSQSFSSREISHDTGSGQGDAPHNEVDTVEHSPETTRPYHPADAINKHLLSLSSRGIVTAVTHDDEWISVLREDDETVPAESELLKRICDKYTTRVTSGGAYLRDSNDVEVDRSVIKRILPKIRASFVRGGFQMGEFEPPWQAALTEYAEAYEIHTDPAKIAPQQTRHHGRIAKKALEKVSEPRGPVCSICFSRCRISANPWQCTRIMIDCMEIDDSEDEDKSRKPVKQGIRLANCGHYFCGACLAQAIYRCLNIKFDPATYGTVLGPSVAATPGLNAKWPVYCPTCIKPEMQRIPLSDVTALQVLGEPNIDEWNHTRLLSTLKLILCPHKGCEETFLPNEDSNPLMQCPRCGGSLCKACKCVWHENMTCEGYQAIQISERTPDDADFMNLAKQEHWRRCPNCSIMVEPKFGCNHITCVCDHHFCYSCGAPFEYKNGKYRCTGGENCMVWKEQNLEDY